MHQCPVCSKTFPSPSKLKRHYLIHTDQKPFSCGFCGKAFNQSQHLKLHLQNVHRPQPPAGTPPRLISTNHQRPSCDTPAARMRALGAGNCAAMPSTVTSSVSSVCLPVSETGIPLKTETRVSHDVQPVHQGQVNSTNVKTSACEGSKRFGRSESFHSSLQLWSHLPAHEKSKPLSRGQRILNKGPWKMNFQSQESRSSSEGMRSLKHQCPKCLKGFCSPSKLKRHFLIHTDQKPFSCSVCWKSYRQKGHLKTHLGTENKCPLSAAGARVRLSDNSKTSHLHPETSPQTPAGSQNSSVELKLQCEIRVDTFHELNETEIELNSFIKQQQQQQQLLNPSSPCHGSGGPGSHVKPFQCLICNRSFRLGVNLIRHRRIHQKEWGCPASVQNCYNVKMSNPVAEPDPADLTDTAVKPGTQREGRGDSFPPEAASTLSAEQQQRINPFHQCRSCSKCFQSPSKLMRHMMIHTGQRPFSCEFCGKRFRQKTHLRVHCRVHLLTRYQKQRSLYIHRPPSRTGGFITRAAADVPTQGVSGHKKRNETLAGSDGVSTKHPDQTPSIATVHNIVKTESGIQLFPQTPKEGEVFPSRTVPEVNGNKSHTAEPMQVPGSRRHKCFQCSKCFQTPSKLKRHEMVHTGLKPYWCPRCGKAFGQITHLKTHEKGNCGRKLSQPVNQQASIKKLKTNHQQLYPWITVRVPSLQNSANTDITRSVNGTSEEESVQECPRPEIPDVEVNTQSNTFKNKKLHTCRICCKNFSSPYKVSRHLLTHSGMRPYKCSLCSTTLTQHGHLKLHEHRCRQRSRISGGPHREMLNANHLQGNHVENLDDCTGLNLDAVRESPAGVGGSSFTAEDLACRAEAVDTDWLAGPEVDFQKQSHELGETQNQATDHCSSSFPFELAFEINKLIQNQNTAAPSLSRVEIPRQHEGATASSLKDKVLCDVSSVDRNRDWCEPVIVFECAKCASFFMSDGDLKQHLSCPCSTRK